MAESEPWAAVVQLSESFGEAIRSLAQEAGLRLLQWSPADGTPLPPDCAACLILAGGAEADALDSISRLPPFPGPTWVVGAAKDHRIALAAVARGSRDYFALPDDLDLLRRTLERAVRESRAARAAELFAEHERKATGLGAIIGQSALLQQTISHARRVAAHGDVTVLLGGETGTGKE